MEHFNFENLFINAKPSSLEALAVAAFIPGEQ